MTFPYLNSKVKKIIRKDLRMNSKAGSPIFYQWCAAIINRHFVCTLLISQKNLTCHKFYNCFEKKGNMLYLNSFGQTRLSLEWTII